MRKIIYLILMSVLLTILFCENVVMAAPVPIISAEAEESFEKIQNQNVVKQGLDFIFKDDQNTLNDQKAIVAIPAPPFKEKARAEYYLKRLKSLGLKNVKMDSEGNVYGIRPGTGKGPKILVEAHLDTVFPDGTITKPVEKDGKLWAPGIADDSRGLAALLSVVRTFNATGVKTVGDIIFAGTVGEEGLGDLRGMKAFFHDNKNIAASISIDGTSVSSITYLATGSHRYKITFNGPGGHSFGAFGRPSAIHALGRVIAKIADVETPKTPRTTYTVGVIEGGTSINSIAAKATMYLDMRSNSQNELLKVEKKILDLVRQGVDEENARWSINDPKMMISANIKLVGDRPAGNQSKESAVVQAAWMAAKVIGETPRLTAASSTNANLPISIGIPAITIGAGGAGGNGHAPNEWFNPKDAYKGPQKIFVVILGLVGIDGVTQPLLQAK